MREKGTGDIFLPVMPAPEPDKAIATASTTPGLYDKKYLQTREDVTVAAAIAQLLTASKYFKKICI
jgi:hypothetical protein